MQNNTAKVPGNSSISTSIYDYDSSKAQGVYSEHNDEYASTIYPSYERIPYPSYDTHLIPGYYNSEDYSNTSRSILIGLGLEDQTTGISGIYSNLNDNTSLSLNEPFYRPNNPMTKNLNFSSIEYPNLTRTRAPVMTNLSTPSDLSTADPNLFPSINSFNPRAPIMTNLSTPSNLSTADPNLYPSTDYENISLSSVDYPLPANVSMSPKDFINPYNCINSQNMNNKLVNGGLHTNSVLQRAKETVIENFHNKGYSSKIFVKEDSKGRFELSFEFLDKNLTKLKKVSVKYYDVSKRHIY
jgi:hypothetical protein